MSLSLKLPHYFKIGLGLVGLILTWVVQQTNAGDLVIPATAMSVILVLKTLIGVLSTSADPSKNTAAVLAQSALRTLCILSVCVFALGVAGCPAAVPVVGPGTACVGAVVEDAVAGKTLAQILADPALSSCVTTVEDVITILLGSSDPRLAGAPALAEARTARAARK
jgi:hypothetical protein